MKNLKDVFEEYCSEICETVTTLSLYDGTYYEGYIFQIFDHSLTFFSSGPLAPDDPIEINLNDIDLHSLCYYSESQRKWISVIWGAEKGEWIVKN